MTRKKVQLAYITNDTARKATFKKRKKGLMKKVRELSTLCGVSACAILYSPYDSQPVVWPPTQEETQRVLTRFKSMPVMEQSKKMMNHEEFRKHTISKVKDQLKKQRKENREMEIEDLMYQILGGKGLHEVSIQDLSDLTWVVERKLKEVHDRIEHLSKDAQNIHADHEPGKTSLAMAIEAMQMQPWFMELMNQQEEMGPVPDEMTLPYGDDSSCFDAFFP
ncbi:hypothetical protein HHK36_012138 [Tetracentron sinense]|uniref:MADS-box domain-containing protein n=1 Tax=Tetracentron sinense TaxID=13715 RepID=A0A835DID6_TETSI|nr:hypothetical protein HHK36_012138 [Tetracentron sinense]